MKASIAAIITCLAPAFGAHAYCIHNDIKGRDIRAVQEPHPSGLRDKRTLDVVIKPGEKSCCDAKNLDCNPEGKITANVGIMVSILGEPAYACGINQAAGRIVKVTGGGSIHVVANPKPSATNPFIARVRTQDRDITGPSGLACNEAMGK